MSDSRSRDIWSAFADVDDVWTKLVLDDGGLSMWTWELATGIVSFFRDSTGSLGYSGTSLPADADAWSALIHPDDVSEINSQLRRVNRGEVDALDVSCRIRSADGRWRWTRICGRVARRGTDGRIDVLAGLSMDVSERRKTEAALQHSERRYRTLVESQGEGVGIVDAQERFTFANPAAEEIFGVDSGALIGRTLQELIPPEQFDRILEQTGRRQEGQKSTYEVDFFRQDDGQRRTMVVTATPQQPDDGTTYAGAFGVFRDITESKIAERTKAELEERVRQTAKMESLGQLAGGVAHDFNNLLSPIIGYTELLLQDLDPAEPMREDVLEIEEAANRARELTRQLTAFSRKQVLRVTVVNLNDLVAHSHEMFRRLISEDIGIQLFLAPDLGNTEVDEGQFQQILMNLTINARDAIEGGGTIRIETRNVPAGSEPLPSPPEGGVDPSVDYIRLTIRDTGQGMDEEVRARIFEPFFSTKHESKGTGLGLATVHGIVRQHNGLIGVDTSPGMGSAFHVYLPRTLKASVPSRARHDTQELATHDETVMVVEDDDAVRRHVCRSLKRQGFMVLEARGGAEAIERTRAHEGVIDLLVTDVIMPGMNGREVFEALREIRPELKVVFMSGYTGDALGQKGVIDDDIIFLQKPFTRRSLITQIEEALES